MRNFIKSFIVCLLLSCLLLCSCAKNIMVSVYIIDGDQLQQKQLKVDELSAVSLLDQLKTADVVNNDTQLLNFSSEGSDTYRQLTLDLSGAFKNYLVQQNEKLQRLIIQAIANTFLRNFSADDILITSEASAIKTGIYDFSAPLTFIEGTVSFEAPITATPDTTPTETAPLSPIVTITPDITASPVPPTQTAKPTASNKPTPYVTPARSDGKKYVALTFDDGPHSTYTRMIVDKLKEYKAGATFFVIGNRIDEKTGAAIKYAQDNGSEIAIHGYTHKYYYNECSDTIFKEELSKTADVIQQYTGKKPTLMRPIGGKITNARVKECGYSVILWNVDSEDWRHKTKTQDEVDAIVNNVMSSVGDGKIILMHEIYENSYKAFCIIMEKLYAQGYEVVTVTELLGSENLTPGTKYYGG